MTVRVHDLEKNAELEIAEANRAVSPSGLACDKKSDAQKSVDDLYSAIHTLGDMISALRIKLEPVMLPESADTKEPEVFKEKPSSPLVRQIRENSDLLGSLSYDVECILGRLQV